MLRFLAADPSAFVGPVVGAAAGLAAGAWLTRRLMARRSPTPAPTPAPIRTLTPAPTPAQSPAPPPHAAPEPASEDTTLRLAHRRLEAAFESFPEPAALLLSTGRVLALNRLWRDQQDAADWPLPPLRADETLTLDPASPFTALLAKPPILPPPSAHWRLLVSPSADPRAGLTILRALPAAAREPDQDDQFLAKILESTAALIVVLDPDGRVLTFNDACRRMTGFTSAEVVGRPIWETVIAPEDRDPFRAALSRLVSTGEPRPLEAPWHGKDGRRHTVLWSTAITRDAGGRTARIIATGIDVTETRRMQQELVQAQRMEAIGQLAGGIAHDFNNLLTAIFGHTALAKRLIPASHEAFPSLERVEQAAEQAGRVIRSLLTFSRTERSDKAVLPVAPLLQDTAALIRGLLPAAIELRTFPAPPNLWIQADRLQIQQAILNLAINARDAMPSGGILRLSAAESPDHASVTFQVEDSGQGIPREILHRIFEPFFTTKSKAAGGGLGLPVAKSIASDHRGTLAIASEAGVGTRASLSIPLCTPPESPQTLRTPSALTLLIASPRSYPRQIMVSALASLGAPVQGFAAADEFAATVRAAQHGSAAAICDSAMLAASPSLAAGLADRRIPLLILGDPNALADLAPPGASTLAEPFTTAQLLQAVRRLIEHDKPQEEHTPSTSAT